MNPHGRLVGRDAALGIAGAALADALAGTGAVLLVTGEPGIGKSALLAEVSRDAASRGARVLRGVGWNGAGAPPYWLWTQVLRGIGTGPEPVALGEASRLLAGPAPGRGRIGAGGGGRPVPAVRRGRHRAAPAGRRRAAGGGPRRPAVGRQPVAAAAGVRRHSGVGVGGPGPRRVPGHRGRRGAAPDGRARAAARSARAGRHRRPDDRRGGVPPVGRAGRGGVAALRRQPVLRPRADPARPRPRRMGHDGRQRIAADPGRRAGDPRRTAESGVTGRARMCSPWSRAVGSTCSSTWWPASANSRATRSSTCWTRPCAPG